MRVIKEIIYSNCKVSIFYMNQKYIIKFEQGNLEQAYKLSEIDYLIKDVADIEKIIHDNLYQKTIEIFSQMSSAFVLATSDYF
jgi:hypothetical protein